MTPEHDEDILRAACDVAHRLYPNASRDEVARHAVGIYRAALAEADRISEELSAKVAYAVEHERLVERLLLAWTSALDPCECFDAKDGEIESTMEARVRSIREQAEIAATTILAGRPS